VRGREVASSREVISEERDISDSRNGEIKRPTRCAVHGSLLCYTPCTTWVHKEPQNIGAREMKMKRVGTGPTEALSLEKMRRGRKTMRDVPWCEREEAAGKNEVQVLN